jgi:hypothetical protein
MSVCRSVHCQTHAVSQARKKKKKKKRLKLQWNREAENRGTRREQRLTILPHAASRSAAAAVDSDAYGTLRMRLSRIASVRLLLQDPPS